MSGIPSEHIHRIFERFYRVPGEGTSGIDGSGLGLAICRGIIERHGGRIWAASTPARAVPSLSPSGGGGAYLLTAKATL